MIIFSRITMLRGFRRATQWHYGPLVNLKISLAYNYYLQILAVFVVLRQVSFLRQ